ncbi:MAG: PmoA family protein [Verrucomicrobia bacterium]|nr:PmoA family protein [Verrucomicrobiota bacterium]
MRKDASFSDLQMISRSPSGKGAGVGWFGEKEISQCLVFWTRLGWIVPLAVTLAREAPAAPSQPPQKSAPQSISAELKADRVIVRIEGTLFTEYLFTAENKYPYFFPVNGPRTGRSVTVRNTEPYPHHSSLFFGCDRVNGGNYWQEGLERGRIVAKEIKLTRDAGSTITFQQDCRWERPGADAPFDDHREISISAPSPDLRYIDFAITLKARTKVRIEKNNHSLFSARVAPEISVKEGGSLANARGDLNEHGTFGKASPWADYRGRREGEIEGLAIFCHPENRWFPPPWFTRDYGFMSPTPMFWLENGVLEFEPGESLHLRYRVIVHAGSPALAAIDEQFRAWSKK